MTNAKICIIFLYDFRLSHSDREAYQNIKYHWLEKIWSGDYERGSPKMKLDHETWKVPGQGRPVANHSSIGVTTSDKCHDWKQSSQEAWQDKKSWKYECHLSLLRPTQQLTSLEACSTLPLYNRNESFVDCLVT